GREQEQLVTVDQIQVAVVDLFRQRIVQRQRLVVVTAVGKQLHHQRGGFRIQFRRRQRHRRGRKLGRRGFRHRQGRRQQQGRNQSQSQQCFHVLPRIAARMFRVFALQHPLQGGASPGRAC